MRKIPTDYFNEELIYQKIANLSVDYDIKKCFVVESELLLRPMEDKKRTEEDLKSKRKMQIL